MQPSGAVAGAGHPEYSSSIDAGGPAGGVTGRQPPEAARVGSRRCRAEPHAAGRVASNSSMDTLGRGEGACHLPVIRCQSQVEMVMARPCAALGGPHVTRAQA